MQGFRFFRFTVRMEPPTEGELRPPREEVRLSVAQHAAIGFVGRVCLFAHALGGLSGTFPCA